MAFANAGSPMIWVGIFHSFFLNAIIGLIESGIIAKFKIQNRTWLIIVANYVSMLIGLNFIAPIFSKLSGNGDFWGSQTNYGNYELQGFFAGMFFSYLVTLVIEFPFFHYSLKNKTQSTQLFIPFLVANTITNLVMTILYFLIIKDGAHW